MTASAFAAGHIFVPLDGSELAEGALRYATAVASALNRSLVLMTASRTPEVWNNLPAAGDYDSKARVRCLKYLENVRGRLKLSEVDIDVRDGFARDEILNAAQDHEASVIVAATHARSGITRWMYGSVASHLAHQSHLPLLIVGRETLARSGSVSIRKIMVPLDGSALAEKAIAPAFELASGFDARVSLVRVVPWAIEAYPYVTPAMYPPNLEAELEAAGHDYLSGVSSKLGRGAEVVTMLRGPASGSLLQFEENHAVDLAVMTTHARAGLQRAVLGSTADRLIQGHAPVLLIRPDHKESAK